MIQIVDKRKCTGCSACEDICPKNAISMKVDSEGFWYPDIDKGKCVNCSKCDKVCPVSNEAAIKKDNFERPKCFAAINKNLYIRFDSTSGGAFSALASAMFREGGIVGGSATDEEFNAYHTLIHSKNDLEKIRSSKHYQSSMSGFFREVEENLKNNTPVLVCGTPCQMAALRNYLGRDYENLIIVDFICLCMPSPKVFKNYIESFEKKYGSRVVATKAKSKELGWRNLTQAVELEDGRHIYQTHKSNPYQYFYMSTRTNVRPSCYECKFKGFPRYADITIGDFWRDKGTGSAEKEFYKEFDNDIGTSVIMVNNKKGLDFLEKSKSFMKLQEVLLEQVVSGNKALCKSIEESSINRDEFFGEIERESVFDLVDKYKKKESSGFINWLKKNKKTYFYLGFNVKQYLSMIKINGLVNSFFNLSKILIPQKYSVVVISNKKNVILNGNVNIGEKRVKGSKLETRFIVEDDSVLEIMDDVTIGYGSDIEVFGGGHLKLGRCWTNCNTEIICKNSITIGNYVGMGRNVRIRDNNGGHFINRPYYKDERPVIIEDKVWIGSNVTIMPGVKIGEGAIVGENSFVTENVPAYTMVSGNPAKVVDTEVLFNWPTM